MFCSDDDKSSLHDVSQDEDARLSPSTTSVDNFSENSCMEDWSEGDEVSLVSNLENNAELGMAGNSETTDKNQSLDIVIVINESILGCPQIQVEDPSLSQSTTRVDNILSYSQNSCMDDWSEGDGGCLGKNLEYNVEFGMVENSETTDKIQSSDIVIIVNEPILGCSQMQVEDYRFSQSTTSVDDLLTCPQNACMEDGNEGDKECLGRNLENKNLNVEETVMEYTDVQPCKHVLKVDPPSPMNQNENEISICKSAECDMPKTISMLELLVLNTRQCHLTNIKEKLAPIWKIIADHRYAGPFRKPLQEREAPGYKEIVKRPLDLSTIKRGLSKGTIRTSAQFQRDILLMLQNAVMYNSIYHTVHQKALEIQRDVEKLLQVFNEQVKQSEMK